MCNCKCCGHAENKWDFMRILEEIKNKKCEEEDLSEAEFSDQEVTEFFCDHFGLNYALGKAVELIATGDDDDLEEAILLLQREEQKD